MKNFFQLGRIKAEGKTLTELEDLIYKKVVETGGNTNFSTFIRYFRGKQIPFSYIGQTDVIPYVSAPIYLEMVLAGPRGDGDSGPIAPIVEPGNRDIKILSHGGE